MRYKVTDNNPVSGEFVDSRRLAKTSSNNVLIDAIKKAEDEDCLIVRFHECRGGTSKVRLESEYQAKRIVPCNLLEHDCGDYVDGSYVEFEIRPFEIKTFKMYFS